MDSIEEMTPGIYLHFGLVHVLQKLILQQNDGERTIRLSINIDGMPLFESSTAALWPILVSLPNTNHVAPFGIYYGFSKPDLNVYLNKFITEFNAMYTEGFLFNNKMYSIRIKHFICDTPQKVTC